MLLKHLIPGLACVVLLSGCVADQPLKKSAQPTLAAALAEADNAAKAGHSEAAMSVLKGTAAAFPAAKEPWLRMAQMCYDAQVYGDAIAGALEVIERDPNDALAHNIVAVSALRVVSKSLTDMNRKNSFNGSARAEAVELSKLLKTMLKEDKLVTGPGSAVIKEKTKMIGGPAQPAKAGAGDILERF